MIGGVKSQSYALTLNEVALLKKILRVIGNDTPFNRTFARAVGMTTRQFNRLTDKTFTKLGNGKVLHNND